MSPQYIWSISAIKNIFRGEEEKIAFISNIFSSSQLRFSVASNGGGDIFSWILSTPGSSSCLMEAVSPYAYSSLEQYISSNVVSACSVPTALKMADSAFRRASSLALAENRSLCELSQSNLLGLSITASLATNRPKSGPHKCYVGLVSSSNQICVEMTLKKGFRSRSEESELCSRLALQLLSYGSSFPLLNAPFMEMTPIGNSFDELEDGIHLLSSTSNSYQQPLDSLLEKEEKAIICVSSPSSNSEPFRMLPMIDLPKGSIIVPGSFNPLHEGHLTMVAAALKRILGVDNLNDCKDRHPIVLFELAVKNADKPPLAKEEILKRVNQFFMDSPTTQVARDLGLWNFGVVLTMEPFFVDKASLFPDSHFVIGADTFIRLLNPKYYGSSTGPVRDEQSHIYSMMVALSKIVEHRCDFYVAGRNSGPKGFQTLEDMSKEMEIFDKLPSSIGNMFHGLTSQECRVDISSTEIRQRMASQS